MKHLAAFLVMLVASVSAVAAQVPFPTRPDEKQIVAATIKTDKKKKLKGLDSLREFIYEGATAYSDALKVEFVPDHEPTLFWLNRFGNVVGQELLHPYDSYGVMQKLAANGIYKWTKKPPLAKRPSAMRQK